MREDIIAFIYPSRPTTLPFLAEKATADTKGKPFGRREKGRLQVRAFATERIRHRTPRSFHFTHPHSRTWEPSLVYGAVCTRGPG